MGCAECTNCNQCIDNYQAWLDDAAPIRSWTALHEFYDRELQDLVVEEQQRPPTPIPHFQDVYEEWMNRCERAEQRMMAADDGPLYVSMYQMHE